MIASGGALGIGIAVAYTAPKLLRLSLPTSVGIAIIVIWDLLLTSYEDEGEGEGYEESILLAGGSGTVSAIAPVNSYSF